MKNIQVMEKNKNNIQIKYKTNIINQTINKGNQLVIDFIIATIVIAMLWNSCTFQTYLKDDMIYKIVMLHRKKRHE